MDLATLALIFAATGGAIMVIIRLSGRPRPPTWFAIGHGALALFGVGLLAGHWDTLPHLAKISVGMFGLAALGGATMFFGYQLKNRPLPIALMLGHGLFALASLTVLIVALARTAEPGKLPFGRPPVEQAPATEPAPVEPPQPLSASG